VRSWIFRHRLRLRAIYAPRPALKPAPPARSSGGTRGGYAIVVRRGRHTILGPGRVPKAAKRAPKRAA